MLVVFAGAPDTLFLLELTFDAALPGNALIADHIATSTLVFVQLRPWELQVSFLATLAARVRVDGSWAEATFRAYEAHRFTLVQFGLLQHFVLELVSGQHLFASGVAAGIRWVLALDALLCFCYAGA